MKALTCRRIAFAAVVAPFWLAPTAWAQAPAPGTPTAEADAETQKAAQALAEKFAGGLSSDAAAPLSAPQPVPAPRPEEETASTEDEAPPMISAFSNSARPVGDHAADNGTFEKQAEAAKRKARRALEARNQAKKKPLSGDGPSFVFGNASETAPRRVAPAKTADEKSDEPSALSKIFNPSLWSLPKIDTNSEPPTLSSPGPAAAYSDGK